MTAPRSIDDLLADARAGLVRVTPQQADRAHRERGALLVDIRPVEQRARDGEIPGAVVVDRNVLEWRLDPASDHRMRNAPDCDQLVVVICDEGYASSLAARTLQDLGLTRATDLAGGFQAWRAEGLPVVPIG